MGLYDGIKDVARVIQKADNLELYGELLDLSAQALDLQNENKRLIEENNKLKKQEDLSSRIIRHKETYVTLSGDKDNIMYCSCCWDSLNKLVQVKMHDDGCFECINCKNGGCYNRELYKRSIEQNASNGVFII